MSQSLLLAFVDGFRRTVSHVAGITIGFAFIASLYPVFLDA
jgi:hypothetical protein